MVPPHRLEDLTPDWRKHVQSLLDRGAEEVSKALAAVLPDRVDARSPDLIARLTQTVQEGARRFAGSQLLPACLDWLQAGEHWPHRDANRQRVIAEITSALEKLPPFRPVLPAPTYTLSPWGWLIPAGGGAALGALLLTPLSLLLLGNRELGLFAGAVAGSLLLVALLAFLATRPRLLAAVRSTLAVAGSASLAGGVWQVARGRSAGWLKASGYLLAGWLLSLTVRPRLQLPTRSEALDALQGQIRAFLEHGADLVLAWCWAHPERLPPQLAPAAVAADLPEPVCEALLALRQSLPAGAAELHDLQDAATALLQRVQEQGYEWKSVARGTPYDEDMARSFDQFALVGGGQPVETLRPALVRHGQVIRRGLLRRVRA
jgi:hypothetical protein